MTFTQWLLFFIAVQIIHFIGTWKLYVKADRKAWEAIVPIYNGIVLMQIINRPKWWVILLFIPVVNILMFFVIWIETIRTFGFYKKTDSILVIITLGFYIYYINYFTDAKFNANRSLKPRSELGEWVSSITFAIIAATLVHTYFMQPFTIPTSSLEKSLLVGDYLFVSKFHYGARVPSTVIAAPMVHDSLPIVHKASYLKKPQLPYLRLPGLQKIKRNEIVCFNWPADSLKTMWGDNSGEFTYKPVDKKTNYVKRCVGIAGDTLELKDGYVYINGKKNELPDRAKLQFYYKVYASKGLPTRTVLKFTNKEFLRKYVINFNSQAEFDQYRRMYRLERVKDSKFYVTTDHKGINRELIKAFNSNIKEINLRIRDLNLTEELAKKIEKEETIDSVVKLIHNSDDAIFPNVKGYGWSQDNMGPIYIPEAGATVTLNEKTLPFYEQIIKNYENNDLQVIDKTIFINGEKSTSYTFKQNYYWLMGDNRHNSLDARYWGFVPFDHVLGKPVMIWFSWDADAPSLSEKIKSIRWDRMFTIVHGEGKPVSYRYLVFVLIALYVAYSIFKKRKKKNE